MSDAASSARALLAHVVSVPDGWPAAQRRRGQAVLGLAAVMVAAVPVAAVLLALQDPLAPVGVVLLGVPVFLLVRAQVARGQVDRAAWLLVGCFLVLPVAGSVAAGELRGSPFLAVVCVVLAGVLLPPRGVAVVGGLALAVLLGLPLLLPVPVAYTGADVEAYLAVVVCLVTATAAVGASVAQLGFRGAHRSRLRAEALADELRSANTLLEERVRRRTAELTDALARERRLSDALGELTVRDPLTGLFNRRHLDDALLRLVSFSRRSRTPLSVAVIDLDDFKSVNDRYTHVVGDAVLREAAAVLGERTRSADVLVRMGGEEFALLMPGTGRADAVGVCERMRVDLAAHDWQRIRPGLAVTASFGVATTWGDVESGELLLLEADTLLLAAKRQGKNRVVEESAA
jgi:diguanylate cyclase (GGDEF)-like protein